MMETHTGSPAVTSHPELGAMVHLGTVADELLDELPGLYGSLFSTKAWFSAFEEKTPSGICLLANPRHVLPFCAGNDTVEILNKAFPIMPGDLSRGCRAIFAAVPRARRIHVEVLFDPRDLDLPKRVLTAADHLVVDLPGAVEDYEASLSGRARRNLQNLEERLRRECPDTDTRTVAPSMGELRELAARYVEWNSTRLRAKGSVIATADDDQRTSRLFELLLQGGAEAHTTVIDGRLAAVDFLFFVGDEATVYGASFDEQYDDARLGLLSTYWAVRETIRRGATRCHLLWTSDSYKDRLGARSVTATRLSVFPTTIARLWSLGEAREKTRRRMTVWGKSVYERAYHAVREGAERRGFEIGSRDRP